MSPLETGMDSMDDLIQESPAPPIVNDTDGSTMEEAVDETESSPRKVRIIEASDSTVSILKKAIHPQLNPHQFTPSKQRPPLPPPKVLVYSQFKSVLAVVRDVLTSFNIQNTFFTSGSQSNTNLKVPYHN